MMLVTFVWCAMFAAVFGGAVGAFEVWHDYYRPAPYGIRITLRSRIRIAAERAFWFCVWAVLRVYAFTRPRRRICAPDGTLLITRWFLTSRPIGESTGTPGYYLHRLETPDTTREEHNHPWTFARTRVLRGWYIETRNGVPRSHSAGQTDTLEPHEYHRISHVGRLDGPTWTLFHAGPKHHMGWGFR